jgi:hypothetical protein
MQRTAVVDPSDILRQIQRDFESRPRVAIAVALFFAAGIAAWVPLIGARQSGATTAARQTSVLSDPFDSQTK